MADTGRKVLEAEQKNKKRAGGSSEKQKSNLLRELRKEHVRGRDKKGFDQAIILVEMRRLQETAGLLRVEYYASGVLSFVGSLIFPIETPNVDRSAWDKIKPGDSQFFGIALDTREQTFREHVVGFIKRTFEESKLQDFLPWAKSLEK